MCKQNLIINYVTWLHYNRSIHAFRKTNINNKTESTEFTKTELHQSFQTIHTPQYLTLRTPTTTRRTIFIFLFLLAAEKVHDGGHALVREPAAAECLALALVHFEKLVNMLVSNQRFADHHRLKGRGLIFVGWYTKLRPALFEVDAGRFRFKSGVMAETRRYLLDAHSSSINQHSSDAGIIRNLGSQMHNMLRPLNQLTCGGRDAMCWTTLSTSALNVSTGNILVTSPLSHASWAVIWRSVSSISLAWRVWC